MLEDGDDVNVCFMDFMKAFDCLNHRLLLMKMRALGLGNDCVAWVRAFLGNREFRVRFEGEAIEWAIADREQVVEIRSSLGTPAHCNVVDRPMGHAVQLVEVQNNVLSARPST